MICKECKKSYLALSPSGYCGNCEPHDERMARITEMGREAIRPIKEARRRELFEKVALVMLRHTRPGEELQTSTVAHYTESILLAADEFAKEEPKP